jgi:hypothetical protein
LHASRALVPTLLKNSCNAHRQDQGTAPEGEAAA